MFTIQFASGGDFLQKLVEIVKDHVDDAALIVSPDGIRMQSMEKQHVALVDFFIRPEAAESFSCDDTHEIGVNFTLLSQVFKCSYPAGICILRYNPEKLGKVLQVQFTEGKKDTKLQLNLVHLDFVMMEIPEQIQQCCKQYISAPALTKILKDISGFSDNVQISRINDKLVFKTTGDKAKLITEMPISDPKGKGRDKPFQKTFVIKYLLWFARASILSDVCEDVILAFDNKDPLLLQYENDNFYLKFFLAAMNVGDDDYVFEG